MKKYFCLSLSCLILVSGGQISQEGDDKLDEISDTLVNLIEQAQQSIHIASGHL